MKRVQKESDSSAEQRLERARADLQERLSGLEPLIRRRLRRAHRAVDHLGAFDLDDIMASSRRRLDLALVEGRLVVGADGRLHALFLLTAERVAINIIQREHRRPVVESAGCERDVRRTSPAPEDESISLIDALFPRVTDEQRQILELRARGWSHERIAEELGVPLQTHLQRWRRIVHDRRRPGSDWSAARCGWSG